MKTSICIAAISIVLITVLAGMFYFNSFSDPMPDSSLEVNSLKALADGQIILNLSQNNDELGVINAVVIDGECYLWSHGSNENSSILKGQTKQWSMTGFLFNMVLGNWTTRYSLGIGPLIFFWCLTQSTLVG